MRWMAAAVLIGATIGSQPALAGHCRFLRTSFVFGQDSQSHIVAPEAIPCHIVFRSARDRSEWSIAQQPSHGALVPISGRGWNYIPARGYTGPDNFVVEVTGETMGRYVQSGSSKISFAVDVVP